MQNKSFILIALILVLGMGGAAWSQPLIVVPAWDLNVVNHSFELDNDGNWVCGHTGDLGLAWTVEKNWIGQDVNCTLPEFCMDCDPTDPEQDGGTCNCKPWDASDGNVMSYMQTNDNFFFQMLQDEIIREKTMYTMKIDAMTWDPDVHFTASICTEPAGGGSSDPNSIASKDIWLVQAESVETAEWAEYSVVVVVPDGSPAIGQVLGVKFFSHIGEDDWRWPFIDNVRVNAQPATNSYFPTPEDGAINVGLETTSLKWCPGLWSPKGRHDVYFGNSFAEVNEATTATAGVFRGSFNDVDSWAIDTTLEIGGEYFWRVDEYNDNYTQNYPNDPPAGIWKGNVWNFKMNDGKAFNFNPPDGGIMVPVDVVLRWAPGIAAENHDVWFSTDFDDVNDRDPTCLVSSQGVDVNTYNAGALHDFTLGHTYYWAVDEINEGTAGSPWRSNVLSFRAADYHVVDNFDSYADIYDAWEDGYYNYSGSLITINSTEVREGNSLSFEYQNKFYIYSEIEADVADLGFGPDWTANGAEALVLWFYGETDNTVTAYDGLYVALEDSTGAGSYAEVRYPGDLSDLKAGEWLEWNIDMDDFAGINQNNVSKIYIGFGDRNGTTKGSDGFVYFEDIRLYPRRCVPAIAWDKGSLDGDCVVDYGDLDVMANQWLIEAKGLVSPEVVGTPPIIQYTFDEYGGSQLSTVENTGSWGGFNGTLGPDPCDPRFLTGGYIEDGMEFDNEGEGAEGDYVSFPAPNLNSNTISITAWIRRDGDQLFSPIVFTRGMEALETTTTVGLGFGSTGEDGDPSWAVNNELCYHWADAENSWSWHNGLIVPDRQWTFIALTVAPDEAMLYMSDGTTIEAKSNYADHGPELFDGLMYLCWDTLDINFLDPNDYNVRHFNGIVDEVRIYDYTLTPGQILTVAGLSGSHYIPFESWRPDLVSDNVVDLKDYGILADNWLAEILWP